MAVGLMNGEDVGSCPCRASDFRGMGKERGTCGLGGVIVENHDGKQGLGFLH